jgi:hypothetical protein
MSGSNNIIKFPGQSKIRGEEQRALPAFTGCSTGYGYTRRNRQNPLRQKLQLVEIAVVEVNKVQYQHCRPRGNHLLGQAHLDAGRSRLRLAGR